jgi:hypothetical protein
MVNGGEKPLAYRKCKGTTMDRSRKRPFSGAPEEMNGADIADYLSYLRQEEGI